MWSHYTTAHSGFCVGFRRGHEFFSRQPDDAEDIGYVAPVEYEPTRIEVAMDESFALTPTLFYRKASDWQYEEEERLIRDLSKAVDRKKPTTPKRMPLDICLFKVRHSAIAEIIYGVYSEDALKTRIIKLGKHLRIPIWESLISSRTFDMERRQIA